MPFRVTCTEFNSFLCCCFSVIQLSDSSIAMLYVCCVCVYLSILGICILHRTCIMYIQAIIFIENTQRFVSLFFFIYSRKQSNYQVAIVNCITTKFAMLQLFFVCRAKQFPSVCVCMYLFSLLQELYMPFCDIIFLFKKK